MDSLSFQPCIGGPGANGYGGDTVILPVPKMCSASVINVESVE